ncbi:MAG: TauD/TfdA family dioxygenase [Acidimicrobiia bacterium]|nr:TauD/TfdA family dioxygenase [Acidimicrobiia bacterium]
MSTAVALEVRRLSPSVGAEVSGIDVRGIDEATFAAVHRAFLDAGMLLLRGQHLDPSELVSFTRRWGEPWATPNLAPIEGTDNVYSIHNRGKARTVTETWHYDSTYAAAPPAISFLSAETIPEAGGDTMWASQYAAYEALSPGMQRLIGGLRALHRDRSLYKLQGLDEPGPPSVHPVVRTHPETGRRALFVSGQVTGFEDMTEAESRPLFDQLYTHAGRPDFTYRHRWQEGDLVMWDNRCTMHYAVHDHGDAPRQLYRTTIEGEVPR